MVVAEVVSYAKYPGRNFVWVSHAVQIFLHSQESILDQIICHPLILDIGQDKFSDRLIILIVDFPKVH